MDKEMLNIMEIQSFKSSLKNRSKYGNDGFKFKALVEYTAKNKTEIEFMDVYLIIGGFEPMVRLDNEKGHIITVEKYHFDFNPRFQNMTFVFNENDNQLVITGKNSPKLGDYIVKIREY